MTKGKNSPHNNNCHYLTTKIHRILFDSVEPLRNRSQLGLKPMELLQEDKTVSVTRTIEIKLVIYEDTYLMVKLLGSCEINFESLYREIIKVNKFKFIIR